MKTNPILIRQLPQRSFYWKPLCSLLTPKAFTSRVKSREGVIGTDIEAMVCDLFTAKGHSDVEVIGGRDCQGAVSSASKVPRH